MNNIYYIIILYMFLFIHHIYISKYLYVNIYNIYILLFIRKKDSYGELVKTSVIHT